VERLVIAYKLLRPGRLALFSGVVWPPPGEWLEATDVDPCRSGVHAATAAQLPLWLGLGELWEVELDDAVVEERKVVARRGRLRHRIDAWDDAARTAFIAACATEARRRTADAPALAGYGRDLARPIHPGDAGFVAARLAELHEGAVGYDAERRRQAEWLVETLGLRH
jgi:hypothetical protein